MIFLEYLEDRVSRIFYFIMKIPMILGRFGAYVLEIIPCVLYRFKQLLVKDIETKLWFIGAVVGTSWSELRYGQTYGVYFLGVYVFFTFIAFFIWLDFERWRMEKSEES